MFRSSIPMRAAVRRRSSMGDRLRSHAEQQRYKERTAVERAYSRLKDDFGGRHVRVRGHCKVHAHIMFGVLALFADQALKLVT